MSANILIVDDEADIRNLIQGILEDEGYKTRLAANAEQAYQSIEEQLPGLIILDIWLQGSEQDGLEILERVKQDNPDLPIIMISGHGTIETAVSAIKQGAYDFIEKPFKSDRLILMMQRALEAAHLRQEYETLKQKTERAYDLIGNSAPLQTLRQMLERVSATNSRVLITGEPGTGKDIAARYIHRHSYRTDQPFFALNCATLRPERLEIELFGSEDGSEGQSAKTGVLEKANGGTLLLDEVADMPLETQGKIVRVLQEQKFQKVGGDQSVEVDVRIMASTNRDLEKAIEEGLFRQDLYYRLNVVPIAMPPLRECPQDIPDLCDYFIDILSKQSGLPRKSFSDQAIAAMQTYEWPGNARQLRNVVEWVMIMHGTIEDKNFQIDHLPPEISQITFSATDSRPNIDFMSLPLREAREMFERDYLLSQINRFAGNISKTAQFIGMERSAFHRKMKSLQIIAGEKENHREDGNKRKRA